MSGIGPGGLGGGGLGGDPPVPTIELDYSDTTGLPITINYTDQAQLFKFVSSFSCASLTLQSGILIPNGITITVTGNVVISYPFNIQDVANALDSFGLVIGGNLTAAGQSGALLRLGGTNSTGAWTIDLTGTPNVSWADVGNSDASGGNLVLATNSIDRGTNDNWDFGQIGQAASLALLGVGA